MLAVDGRRRRPIRGRCHSHSAVVRPRGARDSVNSWKKKKNRPSLLHVESEGSVQGRAGAGPVRERAEAGRGPSAVCGRARSSWECPASTGILPHLRRGPLAPFPSLAAARPAPRLRAGRARARSYDAKRAAGARMRSVAGGARTVLAPALCARHPVQALTGALGCVSAGGCASATQNASSMQSRRCLSL